MSRYLPAHLPPPAPAYTLLHPNTHPATLPSPPYQPLPVIPPCSPLVCLFPCPSTGILGPFSYPYPAYLFTCLCASLPPCMTALLRPCLPASLIRWLVVPLPASLPPFLSTTVIYLSLPCFFLTFFFLSFPYFLPAFILLSHIPLPAFLLPGPLVNR